MKSTLPGPPCGPRASMTRPTSTTTSPPDRPGLDSCLRALAEGRRAHRLEARPAGSEPRRLWSTRCRTCRPVGWACGCSPATGRKIDTTNRGPPPRFRHLRGAGRGRAGADQGTHRGRALKAARACGRKGGRVTLYRYVGPGPRFLNRSAWAATPAGHRLSVGSRPLPQTTRVCPAVGDALALDASADRAAGPARRKPWSLTRAGPFVAAARDNRLKCSATGSSSTRSSP